MQSKRILAFMAGLVMIAALGIFSVGTAYADTARDDGRDTVVRTALVSQCRTALNGAAERVEITAQAIQTEQGVEELLQILTAECGRSREMSLAVTQALYNACAKKNWKYTPLEMARKCGYAQPAGWVSNAVRLAYYQIFEEGKRYTPVGNATMFYNPTISGENYNHEVQIFVIQIGNVRFFEERRTIPEEVARQFAYLKGGDEMEGVAALTEEEPVEELTEEPATESAAENDAETVAESIIKNAVVNETEDIGND